MRTAMSIGTGRSGWRVATLRLAPLAGVAAILLAPFSRVAAQGSGEDYLTWANHDSIYINTTPSGAGITGVPIADFPLLVRLDTSKFKNFSQVMAGGADIRFSKDNFSRHLPYQIERSIPGANNNDTAEIWGPGRFRFLRQRQPVHRHALWQGGER